MRLIDADALDETFSRLNDDGWQLTRGDHKRMESVLFEMPTIDAEPVIHAEWIVLDDCSNARWHCSACKKWIYDGHNKPKGKMLNYCPNCGAKMAEAALGGDGDG